MMDTVAIELGLRIKELREAAGLTQVELAALSLKSVETISNFERGKTLPSVRTLIALAQHLDCPPSAFFSTLPAQPRPADPLTTTIMSKSKLLNEPDKELLIGFVELLSAKSRR